MKTLVLVEHEGGAVKDATLAAVTAAAKLGEVHLLVAGKGVGGVAEAAAKIAGVGKVHVADDAAYEHELAENVAPLVAALMGDHDAFVAPATTTGKNIAPRVAALLDVMQISRDPRRSRARTPSPGRSTPATRSPRSKSSDAKKVHHRARHRLREGGGARAAPATIEAVAGAGDAGLSTFVGAELRKSASGPS